MQTVPQDEARRKVKEYAESVRAAVGVQEFSNGNENVTPCEGKLGELSDESEVYYVQGTYQIQVSGEQHAEALRRARQDWDSRGFTIKGEHTYNDGGGRVTAVTDDEYSLQLGSGNPPAMVLLVSSPCYRTPDAAN